MKCFLSNGSDGLSMGSLSLLPCYLDLGTGVGYEYKSMCCVPIWKWINICVWVVKLSTQKYKDMDPNLDTSAQISYANKIKNNNHSLDKLICLLKI